MKKTAIRDRVEMVLETDRYDRQIRTKAHYWEGLLLSDEPRQVHWQCIDCEKVIISASKPPTDGCTYGC